MQKLVLTISAPCGTAGLPTGWVLRQPRYISWTRAKVRGLMGLDPLAATVHRVSGSLPPAQVLEGLKSGPPLHLKSQKRCRLRDARLRHQLAIGKCSTTRCSLLRNNRERESFGEAWLSELICCKCGCLSVQAYEHGVQVQVQVQVLTATP